MVSLVNHIARPLRGILFDKDGTLLDLGALWRPAAEQTIDAVLNECGAEASLRAEMLLAVGISEGRALPEGPLVSGTNGDVARAIESVLRRHAIEVTGDFAEQTAAFLTGRANCAQANIRPTCPELAVVLHTLRERGFVLGLATSDRPESALLHLQKLGIRQEFSFFGADDGIHSPKPAPDLMNDFCAAFGFSPAECAVVGDSPNDMRFAANSGSFGIFVCPGGCSELPPGAQLSLGSLAELPEILL